MPKKKADKANPRLNDNALHKRDGSPIPTDVDFKIEPTDDYTVDEIKEYLLTYQTEKANYNGVKDFDKIEIIINNKDN